MKRNLKGLYLIGSLAILVGLFGIMGCSTTNPLSVGQEETPILTKGLTISVSDTINAATGGEIAVGSSNFIVSANSISNDEEISVSSYTGTVNNKSALVFEFGPDGLVFSKAATLDVAIAEVSAKAKYAKLYYYDPNTGIWTLQSTSKAIDGRVLFAIYHFSKYAISD